MIELYKTDETITRRVSQIFKKVSLVIALVSDHEILAGFNQVSLSGL
jgi:hypothetical protein